MSNLAQVICWKFKSQEGIDFAEDSNGNIVITKFPTAIPTDAEIALYTTEYEAHLASTQYQRDRVYPSIQDQLDDIYHNGTAGWEATIKAIKTAHPKPA